MPSLTASTVQYHALGLLYQIRQKDRMAVTKMVQAFGRGALRSPFAQCMHIRYAVKVMEEDDSAAGCVPPPPRARCPLIP
jgi:coatomer subunit gamma